MDYELDDPGSIPGSEEFSLLHSVQTGSGVTQPSIQGLLGALYWGLKRQGCEADH
jgi:hypothetical protein